MTNTSKTFGQPTFSYGKGPNWYTPVGQTGETVGEKIVHGFQWLGDTIYDFASSKPHVQDTDGHHWRDTPVKYSIYNPPPVGLGYTPPVIVPGPSVSVPTVNIPTKEIVGAIAGGMTSIGNAVASFFGKGWGYAASTGRELVEGKMYGDKIKLGAYWISMAVLAGIAIKLGGPRIGRMLNRYLSTPYNQRGTLRQTHEWLMNWARRNRGRIVSTLRSAHSAYRFSDTYANYKARYGDGGKTKYVYTAPMRGYYTGKRGYGRRRRKRGFKRRYGY